MTDLYHAITRFSSLTHPLPDAALDRPWKWGEYDEGARFAFFRVYEELCQLGARLEAERAAASPMTTAQRILAQYQLAYRELQAVLLGVTDDLAARAPAEGE
jgi:hypothetical protein